MPQPLSVDDHARPRPSRVELDTRRVPPASRLSSAVGDQVQHDLLDLLGVDVGDHRRRRATSSSCLSWYLPRWLDHVDHAVRPARAGRWRAAGRRRMREKSSSFSVICLQRKASSGSSAGSCGRPARPRRVAGRRSSSRSCRRPSSDSLHMAIDASGLLISCATPAARKPTLASCSLRTTCLVRSCTWRSRSSRMALKAGGHVVHRRRPARPSRRCVSRRMRWSNSPAATRREPLTSTRSGRNTQR